MTPTPTQASMVLLTTMIPRATQSDPPPLDTLGLREFVFEHPLSALVAFWMAVVSLDALVTILSKRSSIRHPRTIPFREEFLECTILNGIGYRVLIWFVPDAAVVIALGVSQVASAIIGTSVSVDTALYGVAAYFGLYEAAVLMLAVMALLDRPGQPGEGDQAQAN